MSEPYLLPQVSQQPVDLGDEKEVKDTVVKAPIVDHVPTEAPCPEVTIKDLQKEILHMKTQIATLQNDMAIEEDTQVHVAQFTKGITSELSAQNELIKSIAIDLAEAKSDKSTRDKLKTMIHEIDSHERIVLQALKNLDDRADQIEQAASRAWDTAIGALIGAAFSVVFVLFRGK